MPFIVHLVYIFPSLGLQCKIYSSFPLEVKLKILINQVYQCSQSKDIRYAFFHSSVFDIWPLPLKDFNINEGLKYPEVFKSTFFQVKPRERSQGYT